MEFETDFTTLRDYGYDGYSALEPLLRREYGTTNQALASLTVFTHPYTVRAAGHKALFPIIRSNVLRRKRVEGKPYFACDNTSPQLAFCWANGWKTSWRSGRHLQFNHIYDLSNHADYYTSLCNICVTPAYVAKLTDGKGSPGKALLKYRAWDIYDAFLPESMPKPEKPVGYDELRWASFPDPISDLRKVIEREMSGTPKSAALYFGWSLNPKPRD